MTNPTPTPTSSPTPAITTADHRWLPHPALDLFLDMATGRMHPDPYAPALQPVLPKGKSHPYLHKRPYIFWHGYHYRLAPLIYECVHNTVLPHWKRDHVKPLDGDEWNTRPNNLYLPYVKPRGRPRKDRMQPEPPA